MRERGNILFLILLAVVLFAALSYAVTQSLRGGGKDSSDEQATTLASALIQSAIMTETELKRLALMKDLTPGKIDLYDPNLTRKGNVDGCASSTCNLFDPAGGAASVPLAPQKATVRAQCDVSGLCTAGYEAKPFFMIASVDGIGTTAPELLIATSHITEPVCDAVNVLMNLKKKGDSVLDNTHGSDPPHYKDYGGSISYPLPTTEANFFGSIEPRIKGARTFCLKNGGHEIAGIPVRYFYHVIWEQ